MRAEYLSWVSSMLLLVGCSTSNADGDSSPPSGASTEPSSAGGQGSTITAPSSAEPARVNPQSTSPNTTNTTTSPNMATAGADSTTSGGPGAGSGNGGAGGLDGAGSDGSGPGGGVGASDVNGGGGAVGDTSSDGGGGGGGGGASPSPGVGGQQSSAGDAGGPPEEDAPSYEPIAGDVFDEMPLFDGDPPNFKANAPAETVNGQGSISNVSVPTLRRFAMDDSQATGFGYIVFPGGAYTGLDMDTHATRLAERVGPQGVAVFALKYRVGDGSNDAPRDALLDAKRAVRMVKANAARWGVDSELVGVIGYSAGSHLALNLIANFDAGDASAEDPIERNDSRPAFVGSMSTWAFYEPTSPFTFPDGVPPVYFCHAEDDTLAPIALPREVDGQIQGKGAETMLDFYQTGGHSTCHPGDERMEGRNWPDKLLPWVQALLP